MRDPDSVREMFSAISPRYDLLNRLLSAGRDRAWRRETARLLAAPPGSLVLDLCGGTGDLSIEAAHGGARVVCLDFSGPMLVRAAGKFSRRAPLMGPRGPQGNGKAGAEASSRPPKGLEPACLLSDALKTPFADRTFDGVTIAFGLRNLASIDEGLDEIRRVLKPGGTACILEFSHPSRQPIAGLYGFYRTRVLPKIGDAVSRREGPYGYLARTIGEFPRPEELAATIAARGFTAVTWTPLTGGIVAVHSAARA